MVQTDVRQLLAPTLPQWSLRQRAPGCTGELLLDQAHLEKKAAAGAMSLLFRVPFEPRWQRGLSTLAREELVHFERTLRLLDRRGIAFGPQRPTEYAHGLKGGIARDLPVRLVDELLVAAIIEARSCERMSLLAREFAEVDPELAEFYADLCEAEARHELLYVEIAAALLSVAEVGARWQRLCEHEATVLAALPWAPRLHSGTGDPDLGSDGR